MWVVTNYYKYYFKSASEVNTFFKVKISAEEEMCKDYKSSLSYHITRNQHYRPNPESQNLVIFSYNQRLRNNIWSGLAYTNETEMGSCNAGSMKSFHC